LTLFLLKKLERDFETNASSRKIHISLICWKGIIYTKIS